MKNSPAFSVRRAIAPLLIPLAIALLPVAAARASDFGDAPAIAQDPGADLGDAYLFLDPNDNTRVIIAATVHGFIVPGEALNLGTFDSKVKFTFEIENTGDAAPDSRLKVGFTAPTSPSGVQTAHIKGAGINFSAPTTPATLDAAAPTPVVTTDPATGCKFFAGLVDDPAFCDLVGLTRYLASLSGGAPNPGALLRGRDTFAGYNTLAIALSVPVSLLKGSGPGIGLDVVTKRKTQVPSQTGGYVTEGAAVTVDRVGNPAVNLLLVPYARRDEYNAAKPSGDAAGQFVDGIAATLKSFGTSDLYINIIESIVVTRGDFLRLDPTIANTGGKGGTNAEAGFPNGRRLADDAIDTLLNLIANGSPVGDGVNAGDSAPRDGFPFFAPPHQPLASGATDPTKN